jgi:hypothetical protein
MATTYYCTITFNCWKEHTCVGCKGVYAYKFTRTVKGQGGTEAGAKMAAENSVTNAIKNQVDMHPCPTCGLYQPDMIGSQRATWGWWIFGISVAAFAVLLVLYAAEVVPASQVPIGAAILCAAAALANAVTSLSNPNAKLDANKALAQQNIQRRHVRQDTPGTSEAPSPEGLASGRASGAWIGMVLLILAAVGVLIPEGMRLANDWPINDEWAPPVVGPGDEAKIYLPRKINSVKGYWNGSGTGTVKVRGGEAIPVTVRSNAATWGSSIRAKPSENDQASRLWVMVQLPPRSELANKVLEVQIELRVSYPKVGIGNTMSSLENTFTHKATLATATAGAGAVYQDTWWNSILGGMGLCLAATGFLIFRAYTTRSLAPPTSVYTMQ